MAEEFEQIDEGLTPEELAELLYEIEVADEELRQETEKAEATIDASEQAESIAEQVNAEEERQGPKERYGVTMPDEERQRYLEMAWAATREKHRKIKAEKLEIQRMAFSQEDIRLTDVIPAEELRLLIFILTREYRRLIKKYAEYINRRLTILIRPLIPRTVNNVYKKFPATMKMNPGFMYIVKKENGDTETFWATPDVPYFFLQGTEQRVLSENEHKSQFLPAVNRAIIQHNLYQRKITEKEVALAAKLRHVKNITYFALVKLNPFWFKALYSEITKQKDNE